MPTARRITVSAIACDLGSVLVFVLVGRASHDGGAISGVLTTLWPFAVGLAVGALIARIWRHPLSPLRSGLPIWVATLVVGMLLRAVSGQGVQPAFVIVAAVVLGVFLAGWRLVAMLVTRRSRRSRAGRDVGGFA